VIIWSQRLIPNSPNGADTLTASTDKRRARDLYSHAYTPEVRAHVVTMKRYFIIHRRLTSCPAITGKPRGRSGLHGWEPTRYKRTIVRVSHH
jgi:hypothetical protein